LAGRRGAPPQAKRGERCQDHEDENHRIGSFHGHVDYGTVRYQRVFIYGTCWYQRKGIGRMRDNKAVSAANPATAGVGEASTRARVLKAAFAVFRKRGFSGASTLEIATRAQVSKRDLYALFGSKHAMLAACIKERAARMRQPLDLAAPETAADVTAFLIEFGTSILQVVCHPDVLAVHRLAIAESDRAPEIARTLDRNGREANHSALADWLAKAQAQGLIGPGDPAAMAAHFLATLWGGLLIQLLLRVRDAPAADEIDARARAATDATLKLYGPVTTGD
jgi:AcrR family transcriptional regulator